VKFLYEGLRFGLYWFIECKIESGWTSRFCGKLDHLLMVPLGFRVGHFDHFRLTSDSFLSLS